MAAIILSILSSLTSKLFHKLPPVASLPEVFAHYTVGTSVYNAARPEESYIIHQLFVDGPYVIALLKADKNTSPWLRQGTMLLTRLASADKKFFIQVRDT
jgi:hypothetical protein